jgi:hypothetical protein
MARTLLEKGLAVHTFSPPPRRFDARSATEAQMDRYGLPRRPDDARLLRLWEEMAVSGFELVRPEFQLLDDVVPDQPDSFALPLAPAQTTNFIAGATVDKPPDRGAIRWIESTWTVANLRPPLNSENHFPYSTDAWLLLDESSGDSNLSAGCGAFVRRDGSTEAVFYGAFWRWFPRRNAGISNFVVNPGDILSVVLCMELDSAVRARITFINRSTKQMTTFLVTAPEGVELTPDHAGWHIHPNVIGFSGPTSARFGSMYFDSCHAGTTDGALLMPEVPVNMTDFFEGHPVASVSFLLEDLFRIDYVGP